MGALVEETLYTLDKKKISSTRARKMREYVELLKSCVDAISSSELSATGNNYRRASEPTGLRGHTTQQTSPSTAHRGRAACMHTDPTLNADWYINKIGKEVSEWGCDEVCSWLGLLGLSDYDSVIHSNGITGPALLDLQTKDILELGFTKVGHMTKLRSGIQTLNPTLNSRQGATKRARQFRETR
ncbi:Diacylglycerol kinase eta [Geodia barretti]|nr:Diacylglycerol kinase eta [Geodia barretti]